MARVVVSVTNVVTYPEGSGHWWVFANWALGLRRLGCDVLWLERVPDIDAIPEKNLRILDERLARLGLQGRGVLVQSGGDGAVLRTMPSMTEADMARLFGATDLLLNFNYGMPQSVLELFPRTALVDIDPGLLQFWLANGQIKFAAHDAYFSTGETVGTPEALFPDCGLPWIRIRPVVDTKTWTVDVAREGRRYTTVSGWYGGHWVADHKSIMFDNNKRVTLIEFSDLPHRLSVELELALDVKPHDLELARASFADAEVAVSAAEMHDYVDDLTDLRFMLSRGWPIRLACDVSGTPQDYVSYIAGSRGEFSCAKPSCMFFRNAWVSDRTLCYLASGKPVVIQDTGPSRILKNGEGMFRFSTAEHVIDAFEQLEGNYNFHSDSARALAEDAFDAEKICEIVLREAL